MPTSTGVAPSVRTATGARFRPMAATTVPVTMGGISRSIQPVPATCATRPIRKYTTPQAMMPPRATPMFGFSPLPA